MRWFKHMTNSNRNEKLARFTDKFGLEAYGFWWRILEIVAGQLENNEEPVVEYSVKKWCSILCIHHHKFRKLIHAGAECGLFVLSTPELPTSYLPATPPLLGPYPTSKNEVASKYEASNYRVEIPNILKYKDEWTRKKRKTPEQRIDTDTDTDTDITPLTPPLGGEGEPALVQSAKKTTLFTPPGPVEVNAYCRERDNGIDGQEFCDFYSSKGWMVGKNRMKDWRAAVRTWENERRRRNAERDAGKTSIFAGAI